jgi:hypothetical protein
MVCVDVEERCYGIQAILGAFDAVSASGDWLHRKFADEFR